MIDVRFSILGRRSENQHLNILDFFFTGNMTIKLKLLLNKRTGQFSASFSKKRMKSLRRNPKFLILRKFDWEF